MNKAAKEIYQQRYWISEALTKGASEKQRSVNSYIMQVLPELYPEKSSFSIRTSKNATWSFHMRTDFKIPYFVEPQDKNVLGLEVKNEAKSGFCAVYSLDNMAKTMFLGNFANHSPTANEQNDVTITAEVLSDKFLEEKFFSWPPAHINTRNESSFIGWGITTVGLGTACIEYAFNQFTYSNPLTPITCMGAALSVLWFKGIGKKADAYRLKGLPEAACNYSFGSDAEKEVFQEKFILTTELQKAELYQKLTNDGAQLPKEYFNWIYETVKHFPVIKNIHTVLKESNAANKSSVSLEQILDVFKD